MRVSLLLVLAVLAVLAAVDARFNGGNAKLSGTSIPPLQGNLKAGDFNGKSIVKTRPELGPSSENRRAIGTPMKFVFTYADDVPEIAKTVFQQAADVWSKAIVDQPHPVNIDVLWGETEFLALWQICLALVEVEGYDREVVATVPLAEKLLGEEVGLNDPACGWDAQFLVSNSTNRSFHYGAPEDIAEDEIDFFSMAMHLIGHALGIYSFLEPNGEYFFGYPTVMDLELYGRTFRRGPDVSYLTASAEERLAMLANNDTYWLPKQDLATKFSSPVHLDPATYPLGDPNSLMTPGLSGGEVIRDPGNIVLNILNWSGYTTYKDDFTLKKVFISTRKFVYTFPEKRRVITAKVQFCGNTPSLYAVEVRHALGPKNKWKTIAFRSGKSLRVPIAEYMPVKQIRVRVLKRFKNRTPILRKIAYAVAVEEY